MKGFVNIVGDENKGLVTQLLMDFSEFFLQGTSGDGVNGPKGFIKENHIWICRQSPNNTDALLMPSRQFFWVPGTIFLIRQLDQVHQFLDPLLNLGLVPF